MLSKDQVMAITGWSEGQLARMVRARKVRRVNGAFDPVSIYKASPKGREALEQLMDFQCVGNWWDTYHRWQDLEAAGLISVERPKHPYTGYQYGMAWWVVSYTVEGLDVALDIRDVVLFRGLREKCKRKR